MELRRNRGARALALVCVLGGVLLLVYPTDGALLRTIIAVGAIGLGAVALVSAMRPFRFGIHAEGLSIRRPGLRREIGWAEVDALVLDEPPRRDGHPEPPRLLLVPVPGVTIEPLTARHPLDGRPAVELLALDQVREQPEQVSAALAQYAGSSFVDLLALRRAAFEAPELPVGLRGYQMDRVDRLIRRGQDALMTGDASARQAARGEIERATDAGLPIAQRGYSTFQTDTVLDALVTALADHQSTDRETAT
ncbi:hypothetical protein PSN13_02244 [Micromonospora saelicesensis]|uniref:DivIVA domain-containing protein n=1 Tax=Micromonospora saelicesensis TaxID=285676 RepID=A0A328NNC6_9ACTN|nr:hypothetical protein [Micromonospora saelicesensis]RAO35821.1 hypothetical protein PSN13_02244 [Micromonospora saelicesensis]